MRKIVAQEIQDTALQFFKRNEDELPKYVSFKTVCRRAKKLYQQGKPLSDDLLLSFFKK